MTGVAARPCEEVSAVSMTKTRMIPKVQITKVG